MDEIKFKINGKSCSAAPGSTILEAALQNGIYIPHLCGHENLLPAGACGMCAVKVKGCDGVSFACYTKVLDGMDVDALDEEAEKIRKLACDLIFKTHPSECTNCPKYGKCQLQTITQYVGDTGRELRENKPVIAADDKNPIILHEMYRCILCGRCVRVCADVRGVGAIRFEKVNNRMRVVVDGDSLAEAGCRFCSACVDVCPTGSIREHAAITDRMAGKTREAALVPCRDICPAHIDVPRYIRHIAEENYEAAASVIREKTPFPYALGYICTHPCEAECKRNFLNGAVSIRNLKRFAAQSAHSVQPDTERPACTDDSAARRGAAPTGKKIAVVGAGPAGLTAAYLLASKGHGVTVFEENERSGGMLRYGVPGHRLPREVLDGEIAAVPAAGANIITGKRIDNAPGLLSDGFDAVLVATGAHRGVKLPIPGADLRSVYVATEFLSSAETGTAPSLAGQRVVVLGGGNVALDCSAVARRLGAAETHVACLESFDTMTSTEEELRWALEEGVMIHNSKTFPEILGRGGSVESIRLASVSGFSFDENGKSVIDVIPGSDEILPVDVVIFAIGQRPDLDERFGLELSRGGRVAVTDGCVTSVPGVFASGDAVTGTVSAINAIADARVAAQAIDIFLGGDGVVETHPAQAAARDPRLGKKKGFGNMERADSRTLDPEQRVLSFDPMDLGLPDDKAICEAGRCLQCDLRTDIAAQRFWTDFSRGDITI